MDILVISGHDNFKESVCNKYILDTFNSYFEGSKNHSLTIRNLEQIYQDGKSLDLAKEQMYLARASVIVLQFPMYWYSYPYVLRRYLDEVLTFGFAFGEDKGVPTYALKNKKLLVSFTMGAKENEHYANGLKAPEQYYTCFEDTAKYCQMQYLGTVYSFDMFYDSLRHQAERLQDLEARCKDHAHRLLETISQAK